MRGTIAVATLLVACSSLSGLSGDDAEPPLPDRDGGTPDGPVTGDGSTSGGETGKPFDLADACRQIASANCARLVACYPQYVVMQYGGPQACETRVAAQCTFERSAPGTTPMTAELTATCVKNTNDASCGDVIEGGLAYGCRQPGTGAVGETCNYHTQCASLFCSTVDAKGCGKCALAAKLDEMCGAGCAQGLVCNGTTCVAPAGLDQPCTSVACATRYQCRQGVCKEYAHENETCTAEITCSPFEALSCRTSSGQCAKMTIIQPGATCGSTDGVATLCAGGLCFGSGGNPSCNAWKGDGVACGSPPPCIQGDYCVAGQCVAPALSYCK